ncbi:MAG: hypothetical protein ABI550_10090, partial [Ignavibacteriaceae bacterium]
MKKLLVVLFAVLLFGSISYSQTPPMSIGVGANLALPIGNFSDVAGTGFGVTGTFEMKFLPNFTGTGTIGYIKWGGKDFPNFSYSYSGIPILVGGKYYFTPVTPVYGMAQIGFTILSASYDYTGP